jgi:hypothetical protein
MIMKNNETDAQKGVESGQRQDKLLISRVGY